MANEMRTFTFGGTTHPIEDAAAIKSAIMSGSNLQLKDADGTVRSQVAISTGGLKRYKVVQDWGLGGYVLKDYDSGQTVQSLTKSELFLLMGTDYSFGTPTVTSATQLYSYTVSFAADVVYAPHLSGLDTVVPESWMLFLPTDKAVLCYYDHTDKEIHILDDQYLFCEMSAAQKQSMAGIGIKHRATGGTWADFSIAYGYYTRSHIYLTTNPVITQETEVMIGGTVNSQSIDIPWTIEAVMSASGALYASVPKIYPVTFVGLDSTENAPYFTIGTDASSAPSAWSTVALKQTSSVIQ